MEDLIKSALSDFETAPPEVEEPPLLGFDFNFLNIGSGENVSIQINNNADITTSSFPKEYVDTALLDSLLQECCEELATPGEEYFEASKVKEFNPFPTLEQCPFPLDHVPSHPTFFPSFCGCSEQSIGIASDCTPVLSPKSSSSFNREVEESTKIQGNALNIPFRPGGLNTTVENFNEFAKTLPEIVENNIQEDGFVDVASIQPETVPFSEYVEKNHIDLETLSADDFDFTSKGKDFDNAKLFIFDDKKEVNESSGESHGPTLAEIYRVVEEEEEENDLEPAQGDEQASEEKGAAKPVGDDNSASSSAQSQPNEPQSEETEQLDALISRAQLDSRSLPPTNHGTPSAAVARDSWCIVDNSPVDNYHEQVPEKAFEHPFELDPFQKRAVVHLERGESVFVAAHTSAGKTVVAEYAIALAAKHMTRAVYTSPIKTLSNQKYRDFSNTFDDVGIVTGDVQINPSASCLIMTTEILRSMLYRGADVIREIECVIFDEVHYVNDYDRGVVWEEIFILLPPHINLVMLSATVPNTFEFADWIGRTKQRNVYLVSTLTRPVPLRHSVYVAGKLFNVVDEHGRFNLLGYKHAAEADKAQKTKLEKRTGGRIESNTSHVAKFNRIVDMLKEKQLMPAIVFAFSRKKCEELAFGLRKDLTSAVEKSDIHVFFTNSIRKLPPEDRKIPQIVSMLALLKLGVGVHHGGVLPIVKEIVEILFSRGLIKILFATETFAMGVNMPAKTVLFSRMQKHDGVTFRELHTSEYIQMSGRAGRRGLDSVGEIIITEQLMESGMLERIILGKPTKLSSRFKLSYAMILNILRSADLDIAEMMRRSFSEDKAQTAIPRNKAALKQLEGEYDELVKETSAQKCGCGESNFDAYADACSQLLAIRNELSMVIDVSHKAVETKLKSGRVLVVRITPSLHTLAVYFKKSVTNLDRTNFGSRSKKFLALVLAVPDAELAHSEPASPTTPTGPFLPIVALSAPATPVDLLSHSPNATTPLVLKEIEVEYCDIISLLKKTVILPTSMLRPRDREPVVDELTQYLNAIATKPEELLKLEYSGRDMGQETMDSVELQSIHTSFH
eukprot:GCRY01006905.1.p1 GENE.GCRY01006905.1~~GCRY01006905.1.p1  ORF type:complete len:1074 (+),score=351.62 GCRY01006905.1:133-3354(+)